MRAAEDVPGEVAFLQRPHLLVLVLDVEGDVVEVVEVVLLVYRGQLGLYLLLQLLVLQLLAGKREVEGLGLLLHP